MSFTYKTKSSGPELSHHTNILPQKNRYDGLVDQAAETESIVPALDGHWISAKLARLAAEELIRQERVQDARAPWICRQENGGSLESKVRRRELEY